MSRAHGRRQIDYTKALVKVESLDDFFKQENTEQNEVHHAPVSHPENKAESASTNPKKANILIPVVKKIEEGEKTQNNGEKSYLDEKMIKKRRNQLQYIRTSYKIIVPPLHLYEVSDRDLQFLKELNDKIAQKIITASFSLELFEKIVETWENELYKEEMLPFSRLQGSVSRFIDGSLKDYLIEIYNVTRLFNLK